MCASAYTETLRQGVWPRPLLPGDTVAIAAPAGAFDLSLLAPATEVLARGGFRVRVMPHATGRSGSYSAPAAERWTDLRDALLDPDVGAVMCARGGYGATHLLGSLDELVSDPGWRPRWLIGFSDISALHAVMVSRGMVSVHAPMLRGLVRDGSPEAGDTRLLLSLLSGRPEPVVFPADPRNRPGHAEGVLAGGNLSVLSALLATPHNMIRPQTILFVEDINEPIYKVERMLWQLRHAGILPRLGGFLAGDFTGAAPDRNHAHIYDMMAEMTAPYGYPVAFGLPVGHEGRNVPMAVGARVELDVSPLKTHLRYCVDAR